ncbi:MAG: penicillin-binding protein 2 [Flavobacteriales bacterium]|nr:penicillin-binding protein 2 [Flavobacteriales bacterium]
MDRKFLAFVLLFSLTLTFIVRLFFLQIINDSYKFESEKNARQKIIQYPNRGYVYDRNNVLLVTNQPAYDLMILPRNVKDIDTAEFCRLIDITKESYIKRIKKAKSYSWRKPSIFVRELSKENFAFFQEKMFKFPGFFIQKKSLRKYPINSSPNVLGYVSEVSTWILKHDKTGHYKMGDQIGFAGIEKSYEEELRGRAGVKYFVVDVHNRIQGSYHEGMYDTIPTNGKDITSTIDINLQLLGERLMSNKRGGIVAIDPQSGEILASISAPGYDPNLLVGRKRSRNYSKLLDSVGKPLYDRGLLAQYPPGSPFKVVNALVALQEGVITTESKYTCHHGFHWGSLWVRCHCGQFSKPHDLHSAILRSCNNYFSRTYKASIDHYKTSEEGFKVWSDHVKSFGLGKFLNNDLPTGRKGLVPSVEMYDKQYGKGRWKPTYNISNAIGQGEILVTPIQLANMTAAIANHGYYYTPHIVKKINNIDINNSDFTKKRFTTIDKKHFQPVIDGMVAVFESERGTARASRVPGIILAGKTGTAQNPHGQDHSIFIAFGPVDNPKIAIAVFVENGYWGSRWAAPIATLMIEKYLKGEISRKKLEERIVNGSLLDEYQKQAHSESK